MKKDHEILDTLDEKWGLFEEPKKIRDENYACVAYRMIYCGGTFDSMWDRQCHYGTEENVLRLEEYVKKMLSRIKKWVNLVGLFSTEHLYFGEYFGTEEIAGIVSPRGSYGYVYVQVNLKGRK